VQITVAAETALSSIDRWEHFRSSATVVNGRSATFAVSTGARAADGYLLYQRAPGAYAAGRSSTAPGRPTPSTDSPAPSQPRTGPDTDAPASPGTAGPSTDPRTAYR
jgi:hypothetical protein